MILGFRDNYWELSDAGFKVNIPTCSQIEKIKNKHNNDQKLTESEKSSNDDYATDPENDDNVTYKCPKKKKKKESITSLTPTQAGATRLVTKVIFFITVKNNQITSFSYFKVRFIIEKQNSILKNKKSLDNIRNSQAGHILIDYRICCAMYNFTMKPCIPDGKASKEIAERILKRSYKKENKLESFLMMKFTDSILTHDINEIDDFPQLTLKQLKNRITFSSFKIRLCLSYLNHLIYYGKIYILSEKQKERYLNHEKAKSETKETKILAVLLPSRHSHSKKPKPLRVKESGKRTYNKAPKDPNDPRTLYLYYKVFIQYYPLLEKETDKDGNKSKKPYSLIKRQY